jgi:RNA polymerase sigma-70 factor, ECF subfamily
MKNSDMLLSSAPIQWADLRKRLCLFICSRTPNGDDAEDILQEVLLRVHTHLDTVQDMHKVESWIYQIARNSIIDYYRSSRISEELPEDLAVAQEEVEESAAESLAPALHELVDSLPEIYRQALKLTDYQGVSQADLARKLGVSQSTIKSRVQRARQMVKDNLMTCCHFEFDRRGKVLDFYENCCACAAEKCT